MVDIRLTPIKDVTHIIDQLGLNQYEEVDHRSGHIPFQLDWDAYLKLEEAGICYLVCAFDGEQMVGLLSLFVTPSLHTKGIPQATVDTLYVVPEHRSKDTAQKMLTFAEGICVYRGVKNFSVTLKKDVDADKLLNNLNFTHGENVFYKIL